MLAAVHSNANTVFIFLTILLWSIGAYPDTDDPPQRPTPLSSVSGLTPNEIVLGSVLPLDGPSKNIGNHLQLGLEKSLAGQMVGNRKIRIVYADDIYEPILTKIKVNRLLDHGIFAMIGNVGTPTAAVTLPILEGHNIPAIGFLTGASLLRNGRGMILNYRASYASEVSALMTAAMAAGIKPEQICAYVQDDSYGKEIIFSMQQELLRVKAPAMVTDGIAALLDGSGDDWLINPGSYDTTPVNENGPVGVHTRDLLGSASGYNSLKQWESKTKYRCAMVLAAGTYANIARFVHDTRDKGEKWIVASISFTGAHELLAAIENLVKIHRSPTEQRPTEWISNVVMSQVTPDLDSNLPLVRAAKHALGADFNFISLEGYIVGKMALKLLQLTPEPLTQVALIEQARRTSFDLEGLKINFTRDGYQGSNLITIIELTESGYKLMTIKDWQAMLATNTVPQLRSDVPITATVAALIPPHANTEPNNVAPDITATNTVVAPSRKNRGDRSRRARGRK